MGRVLNASWSANRKLLLSALTQSCRYHSKLPDNKWMGEKVRRTFINYFSAQNHKFVPSSSVIPKKNEGTYFVNAGMNQFKPLFLGTIDPLSEMASYRRVVNSQKCIRVGGKHNDLDDVGYDTYHHTFFEMLGSWSFADYFKKEACSMAWELLTGVYQLPASQLYVTYFGGNKELGLQADEECNEIWQTVGVPRERILPFGMKDNFWSMGDTGPCGPCTEIHFDRTANPAAARSLVNSSSPDVMELWNLVFMQFDRQPDGSLLRLPARHVDTGLGLERLTAVLQGKSSNYDTDLFTGLFTAIKQGCNCPDYQGTLGSSDGGRLDTAYRIVADHARMFTVAIADGLVPGRRESEAKLRQIIYRCLHQAVHVLGAPPGLVASLVPVVVNSLGSAYPELIQNQSQTVDVVNQTEQRYLEVTAVGHKMLKKALNKYGSNTKLLTGQQLWEIQEGRFGRPVPADVITILAADLGISTDMAEFEKIVQKHNQESRPAAAADIADRTLRLSQHDVDTLQKHKVAATDDSFKYKIHRWTASGYDLEKLQAKVVALFVDGKLVDSVQDYVTTCGILLDRTCFYAEAGGQRADCGTITTHAGTMATVRDVQSTQQYVLHSASLHSGTISVGDTVELSVDASRRVGCMSNHTATHLLNFCLNQVLGSVRQQGSMVDEDRFTFDFTCLKASVSNADLSRAVSLAQTIIDSGSSVYCSSLPLESAKSVPGVVFLPDEVYPAQVQVVSIGNSVVELVSLFGGSSSSSDGCKQCSVELCGGTHVNNVGHLGSLVITHCQGSAQGTKRITAVTGRLATEALENARMLRDEIQKCSKGDASDRGSNDLRNRLQSIERALSEGRLLPKVDRDEIQHQVEHLSRLSGVGERENVARKSQLQLDLEELLNNVDDVSPVIAEIQFTKTRDMVDVIVRNFPSRPLLLLSMSGNESILGIAYVPKVPTADFSASDWASFVCSEFAGSHSPPRGKYSRHADAIHVFSIGIKDKSTVSVDTVMHCARKFLLKLHRTSA